MRRRREPSLQRRGRGRGALVAAGAFVAAAALSWVPLLAWRQEAVVAGAVVGAAGCRTRTTINASATSNAPSTNSLLNFIGLLLQRIEWCGRRRRDRIVYAQGSLTLMLNAQQIKLGISVVRRLLENFFSTSKLAPAPPVTETCDWRNKCERNYKLFESQGRLYKRGKKCGRGHSQETASLLKDETISQFRTKTMLERHRSYSCETRNTPRYQFSKTELDWRGVFEFRD